MCVQKVRRGAGMLARGPPPGEDLSQVGGALEEKMWLSECGWSTQAGRERS